MVTAHFHPPPAKRVKVQSDDSPQPRWLLVPTASRTIEDLLKSLLLRLGLPGTSTYDLYLDGTPILPNEDIALVRDGEQLHLRLRDSPTPIPDESQPSDPHLSATSTPENDEPPRKRKRILTPEGKRRRNARNRRREKRRRLERRKSKDEDDVPTSTNQHASVQTEDSLQKQEAELQLQQSRNHEMAAETNPAREFNDQPKKDLPRTENGGPALSITNPSGVSEQKRNETEVADQVIKMLPAMIIQGANSSNARQEQHLPNWNTLKLVSATAPRSQRNDSLPPTRVPVESGSLGAVRPGVPAQKPTPLFSYVCLEKLSIEPLANNVLEKENSEVQKETDRPENVRGGSDQRTPVEERPTLDRLANQVARDKTSGLIQDEITRIGENQAAEKLPPDEAKKPSTKGKPNSGDRSEKQSVAENPIDVNIRGRKRGEIKNPESPRDRVENNRGISASNAETKETDSSPICKLMEIDKRSVDKSPTTAAAQVADREKIHEATRAQQSCSGDQSDKVEPYKSINPRWKRRRPQRTKRSFDKHDSRSDSTRDASNRDPTPIPQNKDRVQRLDELSHPVCSKLPTAEKTTSAHVNASEPQTIVRDIIDLVDDDEDDASLYNLAVKQPPHANEDRSTSTSPQTIVVSPAEPKDRNLSSSRSEIELVKACSGSSSEQGLGENIQNTKDEACQQSVRASVPRRTPVRPTRLNKPESQSGNVVISNASSNEISHEEENLEPLEALKRAVVRDLQSGSRPEESKQETNRTQSLKETTVQRIPEATVSLNENGVASQPARKDVKRQRKTLRGGLSTIEALRVVKAHAAIRSASSKDMNSTCLQNSEPATSKANEDIEQVPRAISSTAGSVKDTARKKRKRKRGSGKCRRYLTEEQVNRSIFVGHRQETLLPPPELLDLPDGADNLDQIDAIPEVLPDKRYDVSEASAEPSGKQKGVQLACQDKSLYNAEENRLIQKGTSEPNRNRSEGFNSEKPVEDEPSPPLVDQQEENKEISVQISPRPQATGVKGGALGAGKHVEADTSGAAHQYPIRSTDVDSFRQDLIQMLQDTTETLAKVWSKWEAPQ